MFWFIVFIAAYYWLLHSTIKTAIIGGSLFFPDFKRIRIHYGLEAWTKWYGKLAYYIQLLVFFAACIPILIALSLPFVMPYNQFVSKYFPDVDLSTAGTEAGFLTNFLALFFYFAVFLVFFLPARFIVQRARRRKKRKQEEHDGIIREILNRKMYDT